MAIALRELKRLIRLESKLHGGIRAMGRAYGIQPSHICEALKDDVEPTPQVAAALGYRKTSSKWEKVS